MKKSVLLPWERYMSLMSKSTCYPEIRRNEDHAQVKKGPCEVASMDASSSNDFRLDADVIRSCFPLNQHAEVTRLLSLFNKSNSSSVTYSPTGELIIGGRPVHGCHVTDVLDRMLSSNCADVGVTMSHPEASQTKRAGVQRDVKSIAKNRTNSKTCPKRLCDDQQWISRWRPLRK